MLRCRGAEKENMYKYRGCAEIRDAEQVQRCTRVGVMQVQSAEVGVDVLGKEVQKC